MAGGNGGAALEAAVCVALGFCRLGVGAVVATAARGLFAAVREDMAEIPRKKYLRSGSTAAEDGPAAADDLADVRSAVRLGFRQALFVTRYTAWDFARRLPRDAAPSSPSSGPTSRSCSSQPRSYLPS